MANIYKVNVAGTTYDIVDNTALHTPTTWYGTSNTAADTAAKVVTCSGFVLHAGDIIGILFSTGNTASTPTLNVNSTTAKSIYIGNAAPNGTTNVLKWSENTMIYFMWDGTYYRYITSVSSAAVAPSRGANTWAGSSSTAADTQAKVASCANYVLTKGSLVSLTFTNGNTYVTNKLTLNVNSTGAKDVYYNGAVTSATNTCTFTAGTLVTFVYSGSYYYIIAMSNYDNKYSAVGHTHSTSDITGLGTAATTAIGDYAAASHSHAWGNITNPPASYTPSSHTHDYSKVSFTQTKTSGTEIGKITIDGTTTSLYYTYTDNNDKVYQNYTTTSASNLGYQMVFSGQLSNSTNSVTDYLYRSNKLLVKYTGDAYISVANSANTRAASLQYNNLYLADANSDYGGTIKTGTLTASRTYTLPDQGGTVALVSDIPTSSSYSKVAFTQTNTSGDEIGKITIDGVTTTLYADSNTDNKVDQTLTSTNANYPVIFAYDTSTTTTTTRTYGVRRDNDFYYNPSTNKLVIPNIEATAATITTLNGVTVGSSPKFTDTNDKVQQNAAITTAGNYPILLATSTATTLQTNTVNKTALFTYNPSTKLLQTGALGVTTGVGYTTSVPTSTGTDGQVMFVIM